MMLPSSQCMKKHWPLPIWQFKINFIHPWERWARVETKWVGPCHSASPVLPDPYSCSVSKSCPTFCNLMGYSMPGFPVVHHLLTFAQTHVYWVGDPIQLSHPLLLLPSLFPSIRVFPNQSALCIRWPKYWSFSFSIQRSTLSSSLIIVSSLLVLRAIYVTKMILMSFLALHSVIWIPSSPNASSSLLSFIGYSNLWMTRIIYFLHI